MTDTDTALAYAQTAYTGLWREAHNIKLRAALLMAAACAIAPICVVAASPLLGCAESGVKLSACVLLCVALALFIGCAALMLVTLIMNPRTRRGRADELPPLLACEFGENATGLHSLAPDVAREHALRAFERASASLARYINRTRVLCLIGASLLTGGIAAFLGTTALLLFTSL